MQRYQANGALAGMWILAAGLIGVVGNVTSVAGAAMVLGFGLVPPILMMMLQWSQLTAPLTRRVRVSQPLKSRRTNRPAARVFRAAGVR